MPHRSVDTPKGFAVVPMVRHLAQKEEHSAYLSQLVCVTSAVMKIGPGAGEDPFVKAKELITGLINRLKSQATSEASHKQPQVLLR